MRVFISYSHKNREICFKIAELIENLDGIDVWFDKGLIPGEIYSKTIAEKLSTTDVLVALLSNDSVASEWVKDELSYAKDNRKKIVPVWIEHTVLPAELDLMLHRFHSLFWYLRKSDSDFVMELQSALSGISKQREEMFEGFGNEFSETENEKIKQCLEMEKQEKYSFCYNAENALLLGKAYLFGGTVSVDMEKAHYYLKIAKYYGNIDASCYLLQLELEETAENGDEEKCRSFLEQIREMANQGSIPAKLFMGNAYWYGKYGVEISYEKSAAYYEECAKKGNARAQYLMASNYYEGDGVEKDYDLAIMYANLAVEQKYVKAWRRWGKFYRDGKAVKQDCEKAKKAYERGASWGDYNCNNKIGDMYYYGWGFEVDYDKAISYYNKALEAPVDGHRYALRKAHAALAICCESGHGVAKDDAMAADHYRMAYYYGDNDAREKYLVLAEKGTQDEHQ